MNITNKNNSIAYQSSDCYDDRTVKAIPFRTTVFLLVSYKTCFTAHFNDNFLTTVAINQHHQHSFHQLSDYPYLTIHCHLSSYERLVS
mmetsp:Transcript_8122/g.9372  ORF Transcript_8122/g.9372 Transcript_8122/m.9372 type:complete len:88 (+) Transcript_8122:109-372(+)